MLVQLCSCDQSKDATILYYWLTELDRHGVILQFLQWRVRIIYDITESGDSKHTHLKGIGRAADGNWAGIGM